MNSENSIIILAPAEKIFKVAADLSRWPEILPHYRWVRYLEKSPAKSVVQMAARRSGIPIKWTSELEIDPVKMEIRFRHLKAFTKNMRVVWTFSPTAAGTNVRIRHELQISNPLLGYFLSDIIIGRFFIHHVANQTLKYMKRYLENTHE